MQRMTKQRQAVLDELTRVSDFRSAQQIFEDLHSQGHRVGLATVYRSLQGLAEDGRVIEVGAASFRVGRERGRSAHLSFGGQIAAFFWAAASLAALFSTEADCAVLSVVL